MGAEHGSAHTGPPQDWVARLTWAQLEILATQVFTGLGYQSRIVGKRGDLGIDVHLTDPAGKVEVVQCKQWGSPVGEPEIRNLHGAMMHAGAARAYLFAPQGFTAPARHFAECKPIMLCNLPAIRGVEYGTAREQAHIDGIGCYTRHLITPGIGISCIAHGGANGHAGGSFKQRSLVVYGI